MSTQLLIILSVTNLYHLHLKLGETGMQKGCPPGPETFFSQLNYVHIHIFLSLSSVSHQSIPSLNEIMNTVIDT